MAHGEDCRGGPACPSWPVFPPTLFRSPAPEPGSLKQPYLPLHRFQKPPTDPIQNPEGLGRWSSPPFHRLAGEPTCSKTLRKVLQIDAQRQDASQGPVLGSH